MEISMLLMAASGYILRKTGFITDEGSKGLTAAYTSSIGVLTTMCCNNAADDIGGAVGVVSLCEIIEEDNFQMCMT